jgi:hypothetical protein
MANSAFYDVDALEKIAINLFNGWGYNFYRQENQLRADDQVIRSKIGLLLGWARKSVETSEHNYRRDYLPPPSREKPRPDAQAVAGAQALERLSKAIGALQGLVTSQPVPENDRMTQRYRDEAGTLQQLMTSDQKLAGQAELLRSLLDGKNGTWLIENMSDLQDGINAISETLKSRQMLLFPAA